MSFVISQQNLENILQVMGSGKEVFSCEMNFQFRLGWQIKQNFPNVDIFFEYPYQGLLANGGQMGAYIDIIVSDAYGQYIAIELKYKTAALTLANFTLKTHSAEDFGRYDFLWDVVRLQKLKAKGQISDKLKTFCGGYAILLTNESKYWTAPKSKQPTICDQFRLHEGQTFHAGQTLNWNLKRNGTAANLYWRKSPITIEKKYVLTNYWRNYYTVPNVQKNAQFRFLMLDV